MPAPTPPVQLRWPAAPYPMNNGTGTSSEKTTTKVDIPNAVAQTPAFIPSLVYKTVDVVPARELPPSQTHAPVPRYAGSAATLLQGYCAEPAYTIIDGPTAIWMPVVGCISSKADCCPTPTSDSGAGGTITKEEEAKPTGGEQPNNGVAQFPISMMPSQGVLTGCPADYHTVGGTACCPSQYWLWGTSVGGQLPCYSSLAAQLTPPPIPDTLVNGGDLIPDTKSHTRTPDTLTPSRVSAATMGEKPTLAIVNIAFAMQYPMVPPPEPALGQKVKIGLGVGVSCAAISLVALSWFFVRKSLARRRTDDELEHQHQISVTDRFGSRVDMSRVAHEPAGVVRVMDAKGYSGVITSSMHY